MTKRVTEDDIELLEELGLDTAPEESGRYTAQQERVLAGFEDICRFVDEHGRSPRHATDLDIFERLYAVRLDRIRGQEQWHELLLPYDKHGLLTNGETVSVNTERPLSDEELLAELGDGTQGDLSPRGDRGTDLKPVRVAEEIAQRTNCADFGLYKPLFDLVQRELAAGARRTSKCEDKTNIQKGDLFIVDRQKALVAEIGEPFRARTGRSESRLRVIFDNGTESNMLLSSFQKALYKDSSSRRISLPDNDYGPLFDPVKEEPAQIVTGFLYVLRSHSEHPEIVRNREVVHKIGITGGKVKSRIASAKNDPTYLLADVEVVRTYELSNIDRRALENLVRKVLLNAQLDIEITDRFGKPFKPREWFLVPLSVIDEIVERIRDVTLQEYRYDPNQARLVFLKGG